MNRTTTGVFLMTRKKCVFMMTFCRICCLTAALSFSVIFHAQSSALVIGSKLPGLRLANISNYKSDTLQISDFRSKLIILDFWNTVCVSCIRSFPKIDSLQKMFNGKVQFILVSRESKDSVERFFQQRRRIKQPDVPFICADTLLYGMFPHEGDPFHVWLDEGRIVRHLNTGSLATAANIQKVLNGHSLEAHDYVKPKRVSSLFLADLFQEIDQFSYLSKCIPGVRLQSDQLDECDQLSFDCVSPVFLYKRAYGGDGNYDFDRPGRVVVDVKSVIEYDRPQNTQLLNEWQSNYTYNYHLMIPHARNLDKWEVMKKDLDRYFGLEATIECRAIKSLVLIKTSNVDKLKTKNRKPAANNLYSDKRPDTTDLIRYFYNRPFSKFSNRLKSHIEFNFNLPFFDETGIQQNIDIELDGNAVDSLDINLLKRELKKYDLDLVEKGIVTEVLVLRSRPDR